MKHSVIIAVEEYLDKEICNPEFAGNGAIEFSKSIKNIGYNLTDSIILINNEATKTNIESKLRLLSKSLNKEDEIMFFYSGHGYASDDKNYITCYDTSNEDLVHTSISIERIFDLFKDKCMKILFFIDSCRKMNSGISKEEYDELVKNMEQCAVFVSCDSNEISLTVPQLKHGVWSYHLIEAFNGNVKEILDDKYKLTALSLQDYLVNAISFSLKQSGSNKKQTPLLFANDPSHIHVCDLASFIGSKEQPFISVEDLVLQNEIFRSVKTLSGFKKHHHLPSSKNSATEKFVNDIAKGEFEEKSRDIYEKVKNVFKYKRKDLATSEGDGEFSLMTPDFTLNFSIYQSDKNPEEYAESVRVSGLTDLNMMLDEAFNTAFSGWFDRLEMRLSGRLNIEDLIDNISDLDNPEIELNYPHTCDYFDINIDDIEGKLRVYANEIIVESYKGEDPGTLLITARNINKKLNDLNSDIILLE